MSSFMFELDGCTHQKADVAVAAVKSTPGVLTSSVCHTGRNVYFAYVESDGDEASVLSGLNTALAMYGVKALKTTTVSPVNVG